MEILGYFNGENDWLRKLRYVYGHHVTDALGMLWPFLCYRDWWEKANADHIITPKESRLERLMVCMINQ
jgi:hypothetical protein